MSRKNVLAKLADLICNIDRSHKVRLHPVRVAIDGVDASGKTMLADELAPLIKDRGRPVIRASVDDFHNSREVRYKRGAGSPEGYYFDAFNYEILLQDLLLPLGPNGNRRYCQAVFNFKEDAATQVAWAEAPANAILLFDGVFLLRPELIQHWDCSIFVDVDFDISVPRAVARDVAQSNCQLTPRTVLAKYNQRYVPGQKIYLAKVQPKEHANIIIQNNDLDHPKLLIN
jgi:uridine kinase